MFVFRTIACRRTIKMPIKARQQKMRTVVDRCKCCCLPKFGRGRWDISEVVDISYTVNMAATRKNAQKQRTAIPKPGLYSVSQVRGILTRPKPLLHWIRRVVLQLRHIRLRVVALMRVRPALTTIPRTHTNLDTFLLDSWRISV